MKKQIIKELFAYIAEEEQDSEGIIGMVSNIAGVGQSFVPLVGANMERVDRYKDKAIQIGKITGKTVKLKRFKLIEESIEIIFEPK